MAPDKTVRVIEPPAAAARLYACGSIEFCGRATLLIYRLWAPGHADHAVMPSTN